MKKLRDDRIPTLRGHIVSCLIAASALIAIGYVAYATTVHPRTDDAEVIANYIGIAPLVAGPVTNLPVHDNDLVPKGDLLYTIDDRPYLFALQNALAAQAQLEGEIENETRKIAAEESTVQVSGAATLNASANSVRAQDEIKVYEAAVSQAEAALKQSKAETEYANGNLHRIEPLLVKQYVTQDDVQRARSLASAKNAAADQATSQLALSKAKLLSAVAQQQQAIAQLRQSQAQLNQSKKSVLVLAPLLAQRESRAAAVRLARYNYDECKVVAPFDARVTNLTVSEGGYAKSGEQLFTLIDNRRWWVLANFRETQLNRIHQGQGVDIFLMSDSNVRLHGIVESIGHGVIPDPDVVGKISSGLPDVQRTLNWVRLASRYPVRIRIEDPPTSSLRVGEVAIVRMR
jgi:multidrug efflux system membrane fusion protein